MRLYLGIFRYSSLRHREIQIGLFSYAGVEAAGVATLLCHSTTEITVIKWFAVRMNHVDIGHPMTFSSSSSKKISILG